jgi:hypothetical protein
VVPAHPREAADGGEERTFRLTFSLVLIVRQLPYWVRHLFRSLQRLQFVCTFFILVYCDQPRL